MPTNIKTYESLEAIATDATGALTHLYTVAPRGIMINQDRNDLYVIKIYQDENSELFGLFYPLT